MFKKDVPQYAEFKITWKWFYEEEIQITIGNSAEIASLLTDSFIEIIDIERVYS